MSEPVTILLPAILAQMLDGERQFQVRGETVGAALRDLVQQRPALGLHLFDEAGSVRRHILCFHNDVYARGNDGLASRVEPGDTITILNSVSGG